MNRLLDTLLRFCGFLVALFGAAKLLSVLSGVKLLQTTDPVLGLQLGNLLLLIGVIEVVLGGYCLLADSISYRACAILGFSLAVAAYRVARSFVGESQYCSCLGSVADWIGLSDRFADYISVSVLFVCIGCGFLSLLFHAGGQQVGENRS